MEATSDGEGLDALRAWLLTEDGHERGEITDDVLTVMREHVVEVLGPQATPDLLNRHLGQHPDLPVLAADDARLGELLGEIRAGRRPHGHRRRRPVRQPAEARPVAVMVMAEYGVTDPLWNRPFGFTGPVDLAELGVSAALIMRLRAWNEIFEQYGLVDWKGCPVPVDTWVSQGLTLAHQLQKELWDMDVRYFHGDDDRPLREH
ncbi:hypothetical protein [Kineosporia succinea]|uniref:Uncharacterized protein n=1 Tax=Kineosporia succinea TaxID=84632 RepID=A0ABT9PBP2_9ACTN|nr:hypothetical protein [Kineosporia succinea]MDP9830126.1 hypothetical protein [Kineosporia succinea]